MPIPIEQFIETRPRLIDEVVAPVDESEVLRYLGYPVNQSPNAHIERLVARWIKEACRRSDPRAAYVILPVLEKDTNRLTVRSLAGETEFVGAIGSFLGVARLVVAFIATAGPEVERLASRLMSDGEELPAMIVNAVGAERAEAAEAEVIDRVREQVSVIGFAPTLPYSPGYCGMTLDQQARLFGLFNGATAGVTLTNDCLMQPLKSVSGLIGLAPVEDLQAEGSPCDRCDQPNCNMRR